MADFLRSANAVWHGDLRGGNGSFSLASGVLENQAYSFLTRFDNSPGTNPEELIAAAHASCFSMAFANTLAKKGFVPESIQTKATCVFSPKEGGGFRVSRMILEVEGKVGNLDEANFKSIAEEADQGCPISNLLRPGVDAIEVHARLVK